jgi:hypothetical protein
LPPRITSLSIVLACVSEGLQIFQRDLQIF